MLDLKALAQDFDAFERRNPGSGESSRVQALPGLLDVQKKLRVVVRPVNSAARAE